MPPDFELLCTKTKEAAFVFLEDWNNEFDPEVDVVEEVLKKALASTLPRLKDIDGDWVMQMMWQVPSLLVETEYSEDMDVNAITLKAVHFRIGNLIRNDVSDRAGELGLAPGRMRF